MKNMAFYGIMVFMMLCVLELAALVLAHLVDKDDFFDARDEVLPRLTAEDLAEFSEKSADPVTGWVNRGPLVRTEDNCLGEEIRYQYDATGARTYAGFDGQASEVVVVGDSYTNGDEVSGDETFSAQLAGLLGVSVANHGVGGFGPAQSLLHLERQLDHHPRARTVVLAIMYENLYRMVNSYRPVLYTNSSNFTLKPYMSDGRLLPHPGVDVLGDLDSFKRAAEASFDGDFWAKPVRQFPYTLALARSLGSNYVYYRKLQRALNKLGKPEYFLFVESPEVDAGLLIGDVGSVADMDWRAFNLNEDDQICHPSTYGQQAIAHFIAGLLPGAVPATAGAP